jgi:hypothetical protein
MAILVPTQAFTHPIKALKIQMVCAIELKVLVIYFGKEILFVLQRDQNIQSADPSVPQITPCPEYMLGRWYLTMALYLLLRWSLVLSIRTFLRSYQILNGTGNHLPSYGQLQNVKY